MRRSECSSITTETILSKPLEQLRFHNRQRLPIRQATAVPGGVVGDQVWGRAGRLCSTWASFRKSTPMPRMGHFEALPDQLAIGARQPRSPHQPRDRNALDGGQDGLELRWTRIRSAEASHPLGF